MVDDQALLIALINSLLALLGMQKVVLKSAGYLGFHKISLLLIETGLIMMEAARASLGRQA